jgi:hypothetical protein
MEMEDIPTKEEKRKDDSLHGMTRDGRKIKVASCKSCGKVKCQECGETVQLVAMVCLER